MALRGAKESELSQSDREVVHRFGGGVPLAVVTAETKTAMTTAMTFKLDEMSANAAGRSARRAARHDHGSR